MAIGDMRYKVRLTKKDGWVKMHHNREEILALVTFDCDASILTKDEVVLLFDEIKNEKPEIIPIDKLKFPIGEYPPEGGWEARTWYLVDVSVKYGNPVHKSLLYTGFLSKGRPGSYSGIIPVNCAPVDRHDVSGMHNYRYVKAVQKLYTVK